jgi:Regulator of chromosome condensation (RCC1) repeat
MGCGGDGASGATSAAGSGEVATACLVKDDNEPSSCAETLNDELGTSDQRAQLIKTMREICAKAFGAQGISFQVVPACPESANRVGYCERTSPAQPYLRTQRQFSYVKDANDLKERQANDAFDCLSSGGKYADGAGQELVAPTEPLGDVAGLTAGDGHVCAWTGAGRVYCWGNNDAGQLGIGETLDAPEAVPQEVPGLESVVSLAARSDHTCALHEDGSVSCWGDNSAKQLDGKTSEPQPSPVKVEGVAEAVSLATSDSETCSLSKGGEVTCWGQRYSAPTVLSGLEGVKAISMHSSLCVRFDDDTVECSLRCTETAGVTTCQPGEPDFVDAAMHTSDGLTSCVASTQGEVVCGTGSSQKVVEGVEGATSVSTNNVFNCALLDSGKVVCWPGYAGSLTATVPRGITEILDGATAIAGNCALLQDGTISCWGPNGEGERGSFWPAEMTGTAPAWTEPSVVLR